MGRVGFEPTKAKPADLQSAPFDRFGIDPIYFQIIKQRQTFVKLILFKVNKAYYGVVGGLLEGAFIISKITKLTIA